MRPCRSHRPNRPIPARIVLPVAGWVPTSRGRASSARATSAVISSGAIALPDCALR